MKTGLSDQTRLLFMFSCKHVSSFGNTFYYYLTVNLKTCYTNTVQISLDFSPVSCLQFLKFCISGYFLGFLVFFFILCLHAEYQIYLIGFRLPHFLFFLVKSTSLSPPCATSSFSLVLCCLLFFVFYFRCLLFLISFSCPCFPGVSPPPNCPFSIQSVASSHCLQFLNQSLSQRLSYTLIYSDSGLLCCGFCILDCFKNLMRCLLS